MLLSDDVQRPLPDDPAGLRLLDGLYEELRLMARRAMAREAKGATLQPTALVHEALLRIGGGVDWANATRADVLGWAARTMRRILVEAARRRRSLRAGAAHERIGWHEADAADGVEAEGDELLALDAALERLAELDPRLAEVVHLRYFAGLTELEIASLLHRSERSVRRDWQAAKLWLYQRLAAERTDGA